jgi:hypothetical protein
VGPAGCLYVVSIYAVICRQQGDAPDLAVLYRVACQLQSMFWLKRGQEKQRFNG